MNHTALRFRSQLSTSKVEQDLRRLMDSLAVSAKYIKGKISEFNQGYTETRNQHGDMQAKLDLISDEIILELLQVETSFKVRQLASEEKDTIVELAKSEGRYSVTIDPLDGSSLIDTNLSIGSIFGIHDGELLNGKSGRESLAAAMYVLYGPLTTLVYACKDSEGKFMINECVINAVGEWVLTKKDLSLKKGNKLYSPGGLRKEWLLEHRKSIEDLEEKGYKLRYSGALVADINQILMKQGGIFTYPASADSTGKLRLLFELQPMAYIIEAAGGAATDGLEAILDKVPAALDERSAFYAGSRDEVELAKKYLQI